jgi:hypothetical protein
MKEKRKKRRGIFDLFGFNEDSFFEPELTEGGSGYSMTVTYDESGRPIVKVETRGKVDTAKLRRELIEQYPGAKIEGLEPLIKVVEEKEEGKEKKGKKKYRIKIDCFLSFLIL